MPLSQWEQDVFIHPTADVSSLASIGRGTKIWHFVHVREGAIIGAECVISKDVYIDHDTCIGNYVRIQNGVSVYKGVTIEDKVFVGPYCSFTNDLRPRAGSAGWEIIPTRLRYGASVGANCTIVCGVVLGQFSMIAAGSVVTEDALPFGLYVGSPARLKGFVSTQGFEMSLVNAAASCLTYRCKKTGEGLEINFKTTPPPKNL